MAFESIDNLLLSPKENALWELFHENSKSSRYERHPNSVLNPSNDAVVRVMNLLRRVKPYNDFPKLPLPSAFHESIKTLDEVLHTRQTARQFSGESILESALARVLYMSYGVTRPNDGTNHSRPFRIIPSGGALYPLELYIYASKVEGIEPGLYHYDSEDHLLDVLHQGDDLAIIAECFEQHDLVMNCAAICFISAIFWRSIFKYGDRGYRFVLLEAGHLAQNALLTAHEQGLAAATIGGFMDREVDRYLSFDGLNESTIYIILLGRA